MRHAPVVLIVEDDPALLRTSARGLERAGYRVVTAFDCRHAIALVAETAPDVMCIDLCLPDQSGYELCEQVRRTPGCADLPIVAMAEAAFPEHMVYAQAAGANAFVKKPFGIDALVRCIESLLQEAPESFRSAHMLGRQIVKSSP